jgi:hypothetical protein
MGYGSGVYTEFVLRKLPVAKGSVTVRDFRFSFGFFIIMTKAVKTIKFLFFISDPRVNLTCRSHHSALASKPSTHMLSCCYM